MLVVPEVRAILVKVALVALAVHFSNMPFVSVIADPIFRSNQAVEVMVLVEAAMVGRAVLVIPVVPVPLVT